MKSGMIAIVVMLAMSISVYAQERDADDTRLFQELKSQYKLSDAQTYELMGRAYLQQGDSEKAENFFTKAVQHDSFLYISWYHLGLLHMEDPEFFFRKAIEADPRFAPAYYWLAVYYLNCNKASEAKTHFSKYLEIVNKDDTAESARIKEAEKYYDVR